MERKEIIKNIKSRNDVIVLTDPEWDDTSMFVIDKEMLVMVSNSDVAKVHIWHAWKDKTGEWQSGYTVGSWNFIEFVDSLIDEILPKVKDGYVCCEHCGKWIHKSEGTTSGFTTLVCSDCKKYAKPIDTWGD